MPAKSVTCPSNAKMPAPTTEPIPIAVTLSKSMSNFFVFISKKNIIATFFKTITLELFFWVELTLFITNKDYIRFIKLRLGEKREKITTPFNTADKFWLPRS